MPGQTCNSAAAAWDVGDDVAKLDQALAPISNANSTNLSAFERHGGKFLMYHGWADSLVPPQDDINYFVRLAEAHGERVANGYDGLMNTLRSFRLFMVPGMGALLRKAMSERVWWRRQSGRTW